MSQTQSTAHTRKIARDFKAHQETMAKKDFVVATESMTVEDKLRVLEEMGRPEMIELFRDWKPRVSNRKRRGAPLDQRVSITVTNQERVSLDRELKSVKSAGEKITMSQFIRNRALGSVDIQGWRTIAEETLREIEDTAKNQATLRRSRAELAELMDEEDDPDEVALYGARIAEIVSRLNRLVAQNEKRSNRLSGRMSMSEAETIKWRAQRLCLSSSDYLRMMIFGLEPNSTADAHMGLDAKRRFYVSIIEVAQNGWGNPPDVYECSQCVNYMEEIRRLRQENEQLRNFA